MKSNSYSCKSVKALKVKDIDNYIHFIMIMYFNSLKYVGRVTMALLHCLFGDVFVVVVVFW